SDQSSACNIMTSLRFSSLGTCGGRPRLPNPLGIGSPSRSKSCAIRKKSPRVPQAGARPRGVPDFRYPPPFRSRLVPAPGRNGLLFSLDDAVVNRLGNGFDIFDVPEQRRIAAMRALV